MNDILKFPRKLTIFELKILTSILPESKSGYNDYRSRIENLFVIGSGRFGGNNFILGNKEDKPDLSISSSPVLALGTIYSGEINIDAVIHEEQYEQIEFDITSNQQFNLNQDITIEKIRCFSEWNPGEKFIFSENAVREYKIPGDEYVLAIVPSLKKLWTHHRSTGVNHIIPMTNFFNELMRLKNVRNPEVALSPGSFFNRIDEFSSDEIVKAFIMYNKYLRKFYIPDVEEKKSGDEDKRPKYFKKFNR